MPVIIQTWLKSLSLFFFPVHLLFVPYAFKIEIERLFLRFSHRKDQNLTSAVTFMGKERNNRWDYRWSSFWGNWKFGLINYWSFDDFFSIQERFKKLSILYRYFLNMKTRKRGWEDEKMVERFFLCEKWHSEFPVSRRARASRIVIFGGFVFRNSL